MKSSASYSEEARSRYYDLKDLVSKKMIILLNMLGTLVKGLVTGSENGSLIIIMSLHESFNQKII